MQACFALVGHRLTPFPLFFPLLVPFHFLCGLTSRPPSFFSSPREVRRTQRAGGNHSPTNKPAAESGMASGGRSILAVTAPLGNGCADKRRHAGRHLLASAHRVLQRELCSVRTKIHCKSLLLVLAVLPTTVLRKRVASSCIGRPLWAGNSPRVLGKPDTSPLLVLGEPSDEWHFYWRIG